METGALAVNHKYVVEGCGVWENRTADAFLEESDLIKNMREELHEGRNI